MRKLIVTAALAGVVGIACGKVQAQYLMVTDRNGKKVELYNVSDGSGITQTFITNAPAGGPYNFQAPTEAIQVGNEIWISDALASSIFRFTATLTPQYVSTITGLPNIRGITLINGLVYAAIGTSGNSIDVLDAVGSLLHTYSLAAQNDSPWDVVPIGSDLLITDSVADRLERYSTSGTWISTFAAGTGTTGISVPRQIQPMPGGGYVVGAFAKSNHTAQAGVYIFDSAGVQTDFKQDIYGVSGVYPLGNGDILYTVGSTTNGGVRVWHRQTGTVDTQDSGPTFYFIGRLDIVTCGSADFNCDGDVGTDADIEAFFACLGGSCPPPPCASTADFNHDGDVGTDADIEAFFRVLGGGTC